MELCPQPQELGRAFELGEVEHVPHRLALGPGNRGLATAERLRHLAWQVSVLGNSEQNLGLKEAM